MPSSIQQKFRVVGLVIMTFLFSTLAIAFFGDRAIHLPLASVLVLALISNHKNTVFWVILLGIILDTFSPFPTFSYFAAFLTTFVLLRIFVKNFVSNQTFWGALAASVVGMTIFEIGIYVFSKVGILLSDGWVPSLTSFYLHFIFIRLINTTLLVGVIFLFLQYSSPKIRGVVTRSQIKNYV